MSALGKLALLGIPVAGLAAGLGSAAASTAKGVLQGSRRTKQRKKDSESTYGGGEGPGEVGGWPGTRRKRRMFEQSQQLDEVGRLATSGAKKVIDTVWSGAKTTGAKAGNAADKLAVTGLVGSAVYDALTAGEKIQANMRQGESPTQKAARKKRERQERIDRMKDSGRVYDADNIAGKQKVNESIPAPLETSTKAGGNSKIGPGDAKYAAVKAKAANPVSRRMGPVLGPKPDKYIVQGQRGSMKPSAISQMRRKERGLMIGRNRRNISINAADVNTIRNAGKGLPGYNRLKNDMNEIKIPIRPAAAIGGAILAKKFLGPKKKEDGTEVGNAARAAVRGAIAAGGAIAGWKAGKAFNDSMKDSGSETKGKPKPRVRLQYNKDD